MYSRQNRFSPLLLNEGEYYFEDFGVDYFPPFADDVQAVRKKREGRLKICSASVFFDPDDQCFPILKFPFESVVACGKWNGGITEVPGMEKKEIFFIRTDSHVLMKENNQNHPYRFEKNRYDHKFSLQFESIQTFLPKLQNMLRISQLTTEEAEQQLGALIKSAESTLQFNRSWFNSIDEKVQFEVFGFRVTPLATSPGRVLLTDLCLYYQPLHDVDGVPIVKVLLNRVKRVLKRRYQLRHVGVEIFFEQLSSSSSSSSLSLHDSRAAPVSLYLSFKTRDERDAFFRKLEQSPNLTPGCIDDAQLHAMTEDWQLRKISNYDYLMYLNTIAHRSFNDITQYPVFPWIIADYTSAELNLEDPKTYRDLSKPIGALNPDRLAMFLLRYSQMPADMDPAPFLYGTHYSTPGYVLYYLVRKKPEYLLRLQNGRFDSPGRMFHSIEEAWLGVLNSSSDVKELIPEFYDVEGGDFLLNSQNLQLGTRPNGVVLNDVVLPPWARDVKDFVNKCRAALESEYVSQSIHNWIDLIFGYKQRGQAAIEANNLFYYITYEGAVDIEKVRDPHERKSIEAQINEFGQTPHQVFVRPHPKRFTPREIEALLLKREKLVSSISSSLVLSDGLASEAPKFWTPFSDYKSEKSFKIHRKEISGVALSSNHEEVHSVSYDGTLKSVNMEQQKKTRSVNITSSKLTCCQLHHSEKFLTIGSFDSKLYVYSFEHSKIVAKVEEAHESSVSTMRLKKNLLLTGSTDSTVKLWDIDNIGAGQLLRYEYHHAPASSCDLSEACNVATVGFSDGTVSLFDVRAGLKTISSKKLFGGRVTGARFIPGANQIAASSEDGSVCVLSADSLDVIFKFAESNPITCLVCDGDNLIGGTEVNMLFWWKISTGLKKKTIDFGTSPHSQGIVSLDTTEVGSVLVTGGRDGVIGQWRSRS